TLTDALTVEREPRPALLDDAEVCSEIEEIAGLRDALPVQNVELHLAEGRRHLVLHDLDARTIADGDRILLVARAGLFDLSHPTNGEADGCIELEGVAARGRLGRAEHDPDLHPDLIDENEQAIRARHGPGELAKGLAHQTSLETDVTIPHVALDLGLRHERSD